MVFVTCALLSAIIALAVTPIVARMAQLFGVVDQPGPRKVHTEAVPRLGGLAILLSAFMAWAITSAFVAVQAPPSHVFWGGVGFFLLGAFDDVRGASSWTKLATQIVIASFVVGSGVRMDVVRVVGVPIALGVMAPVLTVLWIVVVTNAFNLIDGLDGLATGVAVISGATCALLYALRGNDAEATSIAALVGAAVGFLPFNFSPARIFLGDSGSLLFGYALAVSAVTGFAKGATALSMAAPLLLFALPLVEMTASIVRRSWAGRNEGLRGLLRILVADQEHIHHRLVAAGLSPRSVVLLLYTFTLGLSVIALITVREAR